MFILKQNTEMTDIFSNDKYSLKRYSTDLEIDVVAPSDGQVYNRYGVQDFIFVGKSSRSEESAFHSISRKLSHTIADDFKEFVNGVEYVKRDIVWGKFL